MYEKLRARPRSEGGFTLIELLVVMIIIAILMAVAVPTFLKQKQNAVRSQATSNVKQIVNAIETCSTDDPTGSFALCNAAKIQTLEPTLKPLLSGSDPGSLATIGGLTATDYTVTVQVKGLVEFSESHSAGNILKNCKPIAATQKACDTSKPAGNMW